MDVMQRQVEVRQRIVVVHISHQKIFISSCTKAHDDVTYISDLHIIYSSTINVYGHLSYLKYQCFKLTQF